MPDQKGQLGAERIPLPLKVPMAQDQEPTPLAVPVPMAQVQKPQPLAVDSLPNVLNANDFFPKAVDCLSGVLNSIEFGICPTASQTKHQWHHAQPEESACATCVASNGSVS